MPFRLVPTRDRTLFRAFRNTPVRSLRRRGVLYRRGDRADDVYLVDTGHVRLTLAGAGRRGTGRRSWISGIAGPGEVLGIDAIASDQRRYGAVAAEPTTVRVLGADRFLTALRKASRSLPLLIDAMHQDLVTARWGLCAHAPAKARIARSLIELERRFGVDGEGEGRRIPKRTTHQELAEMAGVHRSTVTTVLNEWIYAGVLLEPKGAREWVITQPSILRQAALIDAEEG